MDDLKQAHCTPLNSSDQALPQTEIQSLRPQLPDWELTENNGQPSLQRRYPFADFSEAVLFTSKLGELAGRERHYPRIAIDQGEATVTLHTQQVNGLHRNDFILAAHADALYSRWDRIVADRDAVEEASRESFPASDPPNWRDRGE